MKKVFENLPGQEADLTIEEKSKIAKETHPDPRSFVDKIKHDIQEAGPVQEWLEKRAKIMVEGSGIGEVIDSYHREDGIRLVDMGGGSGHIEDEIIKKSKDKNISVSGVDLSDHVSGKVSKSDSGIKISSIFGKGEELPIKDKSVEVATSYFTFQELSDKQQEQVLNEMIRIIEDDGKIIIVDEPLRGMSEDGIIAKGKNILRNMKVSKYNLHSPEEWRNLFEEKGLKIIGKKEFREDGTEVDEENPAQFFSYILEKAEKRTEN